ncbi:MAG TPA: HAMP domain-containing sensor histidine kinase [Spirochaetia bacterium]|nr:HAMP domain-containing sensor histidine kinase [Spirochaetia bacterium]
MKARYLGIIFVAAVIVPSILLAVLSIRAAGREEAFVEKQLATTLQAEVTHTAGLVTAQTTGIAEELRAVFDLSPGTDYRRFLPDLQKRNGLVATPFLLSAGHSILWPESGPGAGEPDRLFLQENEDFLSGKTPTPVYRNIAVAHQQEILAEASKLDKEAPAPARDEKKAAPAQKAAAQSAPADSSIERQRAVDVFSQSPAIQAKVYEQAREKGEQVNTRVAQPQINTAPEAAPAGGKDRAAPADALDTALPATEAPASPEANAAGGAAAGGPAGNAAGSGSGAATPAEAAAEKPVSPALIMKAAAASEPPIERRSQLITTPGLFSTIASQGDFGIIPRFINDKLSLLFWSRQKDGMVAGCEIAQAPFRDRIAGVLPSTWSPARIITILDETGTPLATPPGVTGRDWRRPFVSQEIGELLPRWEAAAYLTDPASISAQARSASIVVWILVLILFVSVAGGGTMVLTSVYSEIRLAQKKASFVANVSHELKTPLTSISLFVELLRRPKRPEPEKRERYLELMAGETERLGRLINNVLDFSSLERGTKKYAKKIVDLGRIAQEVVEGQRARQEGRGFTVRFTRQDAALLVDADGEALKQILLNLLSNAEKYSPERKEIDVEVAREGDRVAVHVRDRGIGVREKDRERVFKEFFRVDDSLSARVPGTGLGLTIARRIAREHGGDVTCGGRDDGGSDFVLLLPAAATGEEEQP